MKRKGVKTMALLPNWVKKAVSRLFGREAEAPKPQTTLPMPDDSLTADELAFRQQWGFVSHRFSVMRRVAAEIAEAAVAMETPHAHDPAFSQYKTPKHTGAAHEQFLREMDERPMTAGYAPLRWRIPAVSDFDGTAADDVTKESIFDLVDGLAHVTDGKLSVIPAANASYEEGTKRIKFLGTFTTSKEGICAVIDRTGRMYVTNLDKVSAAFGKGGELQGLGQLLAGAGFIETDGWQVPLRRHSVVIAMTSGQADQIPFTANYNTHVRYHKAMKLPVLSPAQFEDKARVSLAAALMGGPAKGPQGPN